MSDDVVDLSATAPPAQLTTEYCVIGSGPAGATAARLLAERGRDVVLLEEGGDFTGRALTQRDGAMYDQLYMDRGGRTTEDMSIAVLQGRALGGGAVINASDVVPIPPAVLEHWSRRFGIPGLSEAELAPHARAALEDLRANPIREDQLNLANRLLRDGAQKLGLRGEVMDHNRQGCIGLGTCLIGCPMNAKQSPRLVAIPAALAAGARVFVRARVERVTGAQREDKTVVCRALDAKGYHAGARFELRAKTVIVAASAVGSAHLLLQSGIGNPHVGRNLMLQPQLPITAIFEREVDAFRGIPQAYAVTEHETADAERGLWGFRIEAIMGTPGIVSTLLPWIGEEGKARMSRYRHIAASLLLVPDEPSGEIRRGPGGRPIVRYTQRDNHRARLREAIKVATRIYLAAGAREVVVPCHPPLILRSEADLSSADALDFAPATVPLLSAHQQGTVRFSTSRSQGGADPDGQVWSTKRVYVFDSSGYPSSASSHTMAPIITIARALTARLS